MNDEAFKALLEENDRLWAEIQHRQAELKPIQRKWSDLNRVIDREKMRRDVMAEMAEGGGA